VVSEILAWHQTQQGEGVQGSRLKLGVLSGCGGDVHCGMNLETFTIHGWGYHLHDIIIMARTLD
jgi:serine protease inhibitor ecotin